MPMGYRVPHDHDRSKKGGRRAVEGDYTFKVDEAYEDEFKSGNRGAKLVLMVGAFEDRDIKVFDTLVYVDSALWKVDQFLTALGFDFLNPPDIEDTIGRTGYAHFKPGDDGYLKVDYYIEPGAQKDGRRQSAGGGSARGSQGSQGSQGSLGRQASRGSGSGYDYGPPPHTDDDVPF